jgi:hypothetical protein
MGSSPLAEQLASSIDALREQQRKLADVRRSLADATESATTRDRSVTAVVGSQGELREFKFHSEDFRTMPAAELSAQLVALGNEARAKMARRVADAFAPLSGFGARIRESMTGGSDIEDAFADLRAARAIPPPGQDEPGYRDEEG